MPPHPIPVRPALEQLETRCVPSAAAPPPHTPTIVHDSQTIPAVVQAVRGRVDRVDTVPPIAMPASAAQVPPPVAVHVLPSAAVDPPMIALPLDTPPIAEVAGVSDAVEQADARETLAPTPEVIVVTAVEQETEFVVPAAAEANVETVRAPSIPLERHASERAAPVQPATRDQLPVLVWMVGMATLVAPRGRLPACGLAAAQCLPLTRKRAGGC